MIDASTSLPCALPDLVCWGSTGIASVVSQSTNDSLQQFVNNILEGFGKAVAGLGSLWVSLPSPASAIGGGSGTTSSAVPPNSSAFETILGWVTWTSAGIAVMSFVFAGVMMTFRRRHGDGEAHVGRLGIILLSVILLSSASALVSGFLPLATTGNGANSVVGWIQSQLWWYTAGLAVLSIIVAAARMAWTQRAQPLKDLLGSLVTLIAVSGAGVGAIVLATSAGDAFSVWVLNSSTDCSVDSAGSTCFGSNIFSMINLTPGSALGVIALFILGAIALFMTYVQIALMVVRFAMLVILAGILPVAASFTNTEMGRNWFKRALAWVIAFVLYKPAAAIVYAIAFRLTGTDVFKADGTGLWQVMAGLALMLMALVALPALMRFLVPAVAAVGGGGGGAGLAVGAIGLSAAGEVATGAIRASNSGGGGSSSGGGVSSDPTGSGSSASGSKPGLSPASFGPSGSTAASGGGGNSAATSGTAVGGASSAAGGPVGVGVMMAAGKAAEGAGRVSGAIKSAADDATGSSESGR